MSVDLKQIVAQAKAGFHMFPLIPAAKRPAIKAWPSAATTDLAQIATWHTHTPASNWGVACGPSHLVVIDEDKRGELKRFLADAGKTLPDTYRVKTRDGAHYYYRANPDVQVGNGATFKACGYDIDTRADGGYVVAAGCIHPEGGIYEASGSLKDIPVLPTWCARFLAYREYPGNVQPQAPQAGKLQEKEESICHPTCVAPSQRPGDAIDAFLTWEDILEPHGWRKTLRGTGGEQLWTRPGKTEGASASTGYRGDRQRLYVFSTNTVFTPETPYTKFGAYAVLNHGGDMKAAARALSERGIGGLEGGVTWDLEQTPTSPPVSQQENTTQKETGATGEQSSRYQYTLAVTRPSDVKITRPKFLKKDWYPLDVVTIIAGRGGEGKSSLALCDLAAATRGELEGDKKGPLTVAITAIEDSKAMQVARLKALGADLDKVRFVDLARVDTHTGEVVSEEAPSLPRDLAAARSALEAEKTDVWLIDPLTAVIPGKLNSREEVRAALDPLTALARDLNISIIGICHFNKGAGLASDKLAGSAAFRDVARSVILAATDKDSGERVLTIDKSNYSGAAGRSYAYSLDTVAMRDSEGEAFTVPVARILGESDRSVQDIIDNQGEEERNEAEEFIYEYLIAHDGEAPAKDIFNAAKKEGISIDRMKKGRIKMRNPSVKAIRKGFGGGSVWQLDATKQVCDGAHKNPIRVIGTRSREQPLMTRMENTNTNETPHACLTCGEQLRSQLSIDIGYCAKHKPKI